MTTKLVGLKEFRQNLASYTKQAQDKNIRFLVMRKNRPVLEVKKIDEKEFILESWTKKIAHARKQVKQGKILTQEQILKKFGLL